MTVITMSNPPPKAGAVATMVHDDYLAHLAMLKVVDTRKAMGRLGAYIRRELKGTVIAVAGSNGKTGTKNLIHAALKNSRNGTISPKSFNNDIGVPTTIFDASPTQDYLVLEIGTNHPGEILNLTQIAQPDVAVITNIAQNTWNSSAISTASPPKTPRSSTP